MTWPPLCLDCRTQHLNSCDDADDARDLWQAIGELADLTLDERLKAAADALITGNGTGQITGLLALPEPRPPTPIERALAILQPHLRDIALYRDDR